MDKLSALNGFFRSLRLAVKTASFYPANHPAYQSAVAGIKASADIMLNLQASVKAGFSGDNLFIDGFALDEEKSFEDLAHFFHLRRIKSLEVLAGITQEELSAFLRIMSLAPRDLSALGGMKAVLQKEKISHLAVEELDYSVFLRGEGGEVKDPWVYLLREMLAGQDDQKLTEVADTFGSVIRRLSPVHLAEDPRMVEDLKRFFDRLRESHFEKFRVSAAELVKSLIRTKDRLSPDQLGRWKDLVNGLKDEDLAEALADGVREEEEADARGVAVFARLVEPGRYRDVLSFLRQIFNKVPMGEAAGPLRQGVDTILSPVSGEILAGHERWFLEMFLQSLSAGSFRAIDRESLKRNYLALLLELLDGEKLQERRGPILDALAGELEHAILAEDWAFFRAAFELILRREREFAFHPGFKDIRRTLAMTVERKILDEEASSELGRFIPFLNESAFGVNDYLEKIFGEGKMTPFIFQLFFKFYMDYIFYFDINLDRKTGDLRFLEKMVDCLKEVDSPGSLVTLKTIYGRGPDVLKTKILRAMQRLTHFDEDFLLSILKKGSLSLKKEALPILARNAQARAGAFATLFRIPSPFGLRHRLLRENVRLVEEMDLKDAVDFLLPLARRKAFWDRGLKGQAQRLLEKWHGR